MTVSTALFKKKKEEEARSGRYRSANELKVPSRSGNFCSPISYANVAFNLPNSPAKKTPPLLSISLSPVSELFVCNFSSVCDFCLRTFRGSLDGWRHNSCSF